MLCPTSGTRGCGSGTGLTGLRCKNWVLGLKVNESAKSSSKSLRNTPFEQRASILAQHIPSVAQPSVRLRPHLLVRKFADRPVRSPLRAH